MQHCIIGTAGHIDHGKTRLIEALTGINADRLEEERRRGITIDLGFAHARIGSFEIGFVDVPGHERFVKNMLAGIGGIQFVLMVVAANESIMPQTREHFEICRLLGLRHGVVVLTKTGLVEPELVELTRLEVRDILKGSALEEIPIVAVDSVLEKGIEQLREAIEEGLSRVPFDDRINSDRLFRLPIDRVFSLKGFGTVVTGTTWSGRATAEQTVQVYPSQQESRIRSIQVHGNAVQSAGAGQRTALNLTGLAKDDLTRGMMLGEPAIFHPSSILDVSLEVLGNAPAALERRTPVRFHHGSAEIIGRLFPISTPRLEPGQRGLAQIRLTSPLVACLGDRFIIRRYSPVTTIGGGLILDGDARKRRGPNLRSEDAQLASLQEAWEKEAPSRYLSAFRYYAACQGAAGIAVRNLQARTGLSRQAVEEQLGETSDLVKMAAADRIVTPEALDHLENRIVSIVRRFHAANPLVDGIPKEELKEQVLRRSPGAYFNAVLLRLQEGGVIRFDTHGVSLREHAATLTGSQEELGGQILKVLGVHSKALTALPREDIATRTGTPVEAVQDVLFFLVQKGEVVRIADDLFMSATQLENLTAQLHETYSPGEAFSVSDFKDLSRLTRRLAIPLLEYLDRLRVTRRDGDTRVLLPR